MAAKSSLPALAVITMGRSSVDLYGQQIGSRLEDVASFAKSVGGSPTNIAIGTARLGLKYYTFISQVENGFSRVPTEIMGAWARELGLEPAAFARHLLMYYEPEMHRLLFGAESK